MHDPVNLLTLFQLTAATDSGVDLLIANCHSSVTWQGNSQTSTPGGRLWSIFHVGTPAQTSVVCLWNIAVDIWTRFLSKLCTGVCFCAHGNYWAPPFVCLIRTYLCACACSPRSVVWEDDSPRDVPFTSLRDERLQSCHCHAIEQ